MKRWESLNGVSLIIKNGESCGIINFLYSIKKLFVNKIHALYSVCGWFISIFCDVPFNCPLSCFYTTSAKMSEFLLVVYCNYKLLNSKFTLFKGGFILTSNKFIKRIGLSTLDT